MVDLQGIGRRGVAALGLLGALAAGPGCVRQQLSAPAPEAGCSACTEDALLMPGMPLEVGTSWVGHCEMESLVSFREFLGKPASGPHYYSCGSRRYRVEVRCEGRCVLSGDTGAIRAEAREGRAGLSVTPVDVGPFSFSVVMTEIGGSERHEYRSPVMTVRAPDAIGLLCLYERDNLNPFEPCDERPLKAKKPLFLAAGELGGMRRVLPLPVLNGRVDVPGRELRVLLDYVGVRSLRDLFPEAASGEGVRPGEYNVTLEFAGERVVQVLRVE